MSDSDLVISDWQPSASLAALHLRAQCLARIRQFFAERRVLEVDTPQIGHAGTVDPLLDSLSVNVQYAGQTETCWLQTSPEFHMKRLLAAGSGAIYQLSHAFRNHESGTFHNPEFTMLEWYQPDYSLALLLQECMALIEAVLEKPIQLRQYRYRQLCQDYLQLDPFTTANEQLYQRAAQLRGGSVAHWTVSECWDLLFSHLIEPQLGQDITEDQPCLAAVCDYPAWQAALAKVRPDQEDGSLVAARFEVYWRGIELANGYDELLDAEEQRQRLLADQTVRKQFSQPFVALDERFINALTHGMPNCCGIALGVDRLIMLAGNYLNLTEIIAFPFARA